MESIFAEMASKWPSAIVSRTSIKEFTGGLLSERYCANLDSLGKGCPSRVRIGGRRVAYPVNELVKWLEARSEVIPERNK